MSYGIACRTSELGIRMALGADRRRIIWLVFRGTFLVVFYGLLMGLTASFWLMRLVRSMLFGIQPTDPATMAVAVALIILTAAFAGYCAPSRGS
jgi:ABC-type antimicrobial peptide transport system permease subunit